MTTFTRWRRRFPAALSIAVALSFAPAAFTPTPEARAMTRRDSSISARFCDYHWREGPWHVKQLIRCSARRWHVAGGPDKAVAVARCESGFRPEAYNPGGYAGVFQQATRYWLDRSSRFGFRHWSVFNGRANIIVSVRMAHRYGWGGWGCA
ncbi:MAG TPA: hypothetical protein VGR41_08705 [Actinomycetota bacterium]|jgi:hypothetical protein|nr:hypothetical protein [Actinomycetota bacterium]